MTRIRSARPLKTDSRGFTLLELLVAFVITALVLTLLFASFRMGLNSYASSQERLEDRAEQRVLMDLARRQLGSLFALQPTGAFLEAQGTEVQEGDGFPLEGLRVPLFHGTPEAVTFVTVAPLLLHENPGLVVVRYGLAQDQDGIHFLGAMETRYLGLHTFLEMAELPAGRPLPLVNSLSSLEFSYYGYDPERETYDWFSYWNGEETRAVPRAVRIRFDDDQLVLPVNAVFFGRLRQGGDPLARSPQYLPQTQ